MQHDRPPTRCQRKASLRRTIGRFSTQLRTLQRQLDAILTRYCEREGEEHHSAAARFDHIGFSELTASPPEGSQAPLVTTWEAPVTRVEVGAGFNIRRNVVLKAVVQQNWRQEAAEQSDLVIAAQTQFWF